MDISSLESVAVDMYRRKGFDPSSPVSTLRLARSLHGPSCIERPASLVGSYPASTWVLRGERKISVRRRVPLDEVAFYVGHELAHAELGVPHGADGEVEAACNYLGAALMAPRPAVLALHRAFGWDLEEIAAEVVATQTWAALRLAEALIVPTAALSPQIVRVRGPEEWVWPDEATIRRWSTRPRPGVRKINVTDRPRRSVHLAG